LGRQKSFADGSTILKYINEAADEYKVRDHCLPTKKSTFNFNTQAKLWTTATNPITEKETSYTCQFILAAAVITTTPKATRLILKTSLFFKAHNSSTAMA
jgi:cation diffusion facilitator CzcD-associated flavoprotein CzcO